MPPRLLEQYRNEVQSALREEFSYRNAMEIPRVSKVVVNIGLGEALENARALDTATEDIGTITGQKPVITRAKSSVANFKVREGNQIGAACTLRGQRMWEFLDRTINAALPRIRDFRGVSRTAFDGRGNYSLGLREQIIFPEIDYAAVDRIRGLQINIVTTARSDEEGRRLLELLGMPLARAE
jgi:large subunit ribosomal protein L5